MSNFWDPVDFSITLSQEKIKVEKVEVIIPKNALKITKELRNASSGKKIKEGDLTATSSANNDYDYNGRLLSLSYGELSTCFIKSVGQKLVSFIQQCMAIIAQSLNE